MAHEHAHRLIYAADPSFDDCRDFKSAYTKAAHFLEETTESLRDTGIVFKGNTIFRILGAVSLGHVAAAGLKIFADYKLFDVLGTMKNDLSWLRLLPNLEILTICERVPMRVFQEAANMLPDTVIAPIYPLTDLEDAEFMQRGETSREAAVRAFFERVAKLPAKGVICAPVDLALTPPGFTENREIITPGIRNAGPANANDTNAVNALTIRSAILAGSTRLVAGTMLRENNDLRGNVNRAIDQIGEALIERNGG